MLLVNATACRVHCRTRAAVFMVEATAVAAVAMAKATSNIRKATEAARKTLECPSVSMHESPVDSFAFGLRTAKQTLQRVQSPPHQNRSHREKRRPRDARFSGTWSGLV